MKISPLWFGVPLLTGCASTVFMPKVEAIGPYRNLSAVTRAATELPERSASDVKVLIESLPDGMVSNNGELVADPARFELLGKVRASFKDPSAANLGLWLYPYKESESWRKGYCLWQVPLSWVTLSLWSWLVPAYYPCRVGAGKEEDRRADIVEALQRATKALGGDLVIVAGFGGVDFITINGRSGAVMSSTTIDTLIGEGYAFRATASLPTPR